MSTEMRSKCLRCGGKGWYEELHEEYDFDDNLVETLVQIQCPCVVEMPEQEEEK